MALILERCLSLFSLLGLPTSNYRIAANPLDTFLPLKKKCIRLQASMISCRFACLWFTHIRIIHIVHKRFQRYHVTR
nr:MAG TPA: hypothetical protein [Caudoviricetes sp.]